MYACINQMDQKANEGRQYLATIHHSPIFLHVLQYIVEEAGQFYIPLEEKLNGWFWWIRLF